MKKNKFSKLIINLTDAWMLWMKYNSASQNNHLPIAVRKNAGIKCEELIDQRYEIIDKLDNFFEEQDDKISP